MPENIIIVSKPGKSKLQLLNSLENLSSEFAVQIAENDVTLNKITDGYNIKGAKKILFLSFWVDAKLIAKDEKIELSWETNAPAGKVNEAMEKVKKVLERC